MRTILQGIGNGLSDILEELFKASPGQKYSAAFDTDSPSLSIFNHGMSINGSAVLDKTTSCRNVLLCGKTGSGKSSCVIIPSIFSISRGRSSMLIHDISGGELFQKTSGHLARLGYLIYVVDFSDGSVSLKFNPLLSLNTISGIQKTALLIYRNAVGKTSGETFFENSAIMTMAIFLRLIIFHTPPEFRTLQNLLRIVLQYVIDPTPVDRMYLESGDADLIAQYKSLIQMGERTIQSVIAQLKTSLALFSDPQACHVTASNQLDLNLLRSHPVAIYVRNPLPDLEYYRPLTALFFQTVFNFCLSGIVPKDARKIFILLDEGSNYIFPNAGTLFSNIRKMSAGILYGCQDTSSLNVYGDDANQIKTNCNKIYIGSQPLHIAKELSQLLGKGTVETEKGETIRELMTIDEIYKHKDILAFIDTEILKLKAIPYFHHLAFSRYSHIPPYELPKQTTNMPSLIQF